MNRFYESVAAVLEVGSVTGDMRFRESPLWCSLQGFGLLVLLENDFAAPLDVTRFLELQTVDDLFFEAFAALAAEVFGVSRTVLSPDTAYESIPEWDSVNHLRLVMEAEKRFGLSYPIERIPALRRLGDFLRG